MRAAAREDAVSTITVEGAETLRDADVIRNWLGFQGMPVTFNRSAPDAWGTEAWRALGLNSSEVGLLGEITRNADGKLSQDFANLDAQLDFLTNTLGQTGPGFFVGLPPRALSSSPDDEHCYVYAPADYHEWHQVVSGAVRHLADERGFAGSSYQIWGEPESWVSWRGHPGRRPESMELLYDYVEFFVWSWRAIKSADPTAKVGGPMTSTYSSEMNRAYGHGFGMDDFVAALAERKRLHPDQSITLDEVIWQDYDWQRNDTLADGVEHVRAVLARNGFSPDTPQVLIGWNTGYEPERPKSLFEHASYVAAMIIEQLNMGERGIQRGYLWPFDYDYQFPNIAAVEIPYPEQTLGGEPGTWDNTWYGPRKVYPAVTEHRKRPKYAVLEMLRAMSSGQFVRMKVPAGCPLRAMAVRDDATHAVSAMLANYARAGASAKIRFADLPFGKGAATGSLRRVDEAHSADGRGLEAGTERRLALVGRAAELPVSLPPWSVLQVRVTP